MSVGNRIKMSTLYKLQKRDKLRLWTDYGRRMLPQWLVNNMAKRLLNGFDFD